ncbi:C2H2 transcription factor (TFIIIA) [Aspergillus flavus]|nr:C2H2 transcription factor (TFIIIA) [Aspergillus flavus]
MGQKRKASKGFDTPKKILKQTALDDTDPIYEEAHSDYDYESSDEGSIDSNSLHETPATPISTISARYPSELKTHRCPFDGCTKAFNRPARLQEHLRSHNNERLFKCTHDNCDKTFLRASHLNHHIKSAHTGVRDYVCDRPGCGKSFVTGSRLRRHLAAHDGKEKYRCTEYPPCNETFRKHSTLQKHITTVHLKRKPFQCPNIDPSTGQQCSMAFDTAGHLRAHESRVHTEKRFSCTECSQHMEVTDPSSNNPSAGMSAVTFPTYALLQAHIKTAHPPQCPNCSITCSTARELRRHLEVAHGDVSLEERKVFPCVVPGCDRSFTKKGNLTVHIRTVHQGEKRFVCGETDLSGSKRVAGWNGDGCGKRYGSKLALEEHIRTAHLGCLNAKAERRQRLGLGKGQQNAQNRPTGISALAALTGEGYAEETGRRISCFFDTCAHRFHRNYDLWLHMGSKHSCTEDEIRDMFMQRALLAEDSEPITGDMLGIYGLEFDNDDPSYEPYILGEASGASADLSAKDENTLAGLNLQEFPSTLEFDSNFMMQDVNSKTSNADDMAMIDPLLAYNMMDA